MVYDFGLELDIGSNKMPPQQKRLDFDGLKRLELFSGSCVSRQGGPLL